MPYWALNLLANTLKIVEYRQESSLFVAQQPLKEIRMPSDNLTKVLLAIIAASTTLIAVAMIAPSANARDDGITKIAICNPTTGNCAYVGEKGNLRVSTQNN